MNDNLKQLEQELEAEALRINAGRKPKFGDLMRNPWASESNPIRDGYFVRKCGAGFDAYYEFTNGNGKFWKTRARFAFFIEAARATPAQPVPFTSSVGAAIRALQLPYVKVSPNGALSQGFRDTANCGAEAMRDQIIALLPSLLSEAAALAEQVQGQGQQVPELVSIDDMCAILKDMLIEADEYTNSNIVYRVTFDQLRLLYMKGIAAAPSIAQDGQKLEADHG